MNALLGDLHAERTARIPVTWSRTGGGVYVGERPGLHVGSITWTGAQLLLDFLTPALLAAAAPTTAAAAAPATVDAAVPPRLCVLELGAGTGLLGFSLAAAGHDVTLTDRDGIDLLSATAAKNAELIASRGGRATVAHLDWARPASGPDSLPEADIVVGADILYSGACVGPLLSTLAALIPEHNRRARFFLCYKPREKEAEAGFFQALAGYGFSRCEEVHVTGEHRIFLIAR